MPVVSKYCDKCGIKIPIEDFEDGHALEYEQAYYCRNCKGSVAQISERQARAKGAGSSGVPKSSRAKISRGKTAGGNAGRVAPLPKRRRTGQAKTGAVQSPEGRKKVPAASRTSAAPTRSSRPGARNRSGRSSARAIPLTRKRGVSARRTAAQREAADAPVEEKAGFSRYVLFGGIGLAITLIVVTIILISRRGDEAGKGAPGAGEETAAVETADLRAEQKVLDDLKEYIGSYPDDIRVIGDLVAEAKVKIEDAGLLDELRSIWKEAESEAIRILTQRLEEVLQDAQDMADAEEYDRALMILREDTPGELRETVAWKKVEKLEATVMKYKKADDDLSYYEARAARLAGEGKIVEARGTIDAVDLAKYEGTPAHARLTALVETYQNAEWKDEDREAVMAHLQERFDKEEALILTYASPEEREYELALRKLEELRRTYGEAGFEDRIRGIEEKVKQAFKGDVMKVAARGGEPLIASNLLMWSFGMGGDSSAWKTDKRGGENILVAEVTGDGSTIHYKAFSWKDYMVEFEAKVILGDLFLGMRFGGGFGARAYGKIPIKGKSSSWTKFRFLVMGSNYYSVDPATGELTDLKVRQKGKAQDRGSIAFIIEGQGSVQIRRAKHWDMAIKR
ncbi:MAG: hypothetical protein O7H41_16665 [Planctomycetota bacterium]|nr:hypothetical protein [Planctomycetota bacterium]